MTYTLEELKAAFRTLITSELQEPRDTIYKMPVWADGAFTGEYIETPSVTVTKVFTGSLGDKRYAISADLEYVNGEPLHQNNKREMVAQDAIVHAMLRQLNLFGPRGV